MKVLDLSHEIHPAMTVFPGSAPPELTELARVDQQGYAERRLCLSTHMGTHLDVPAHMEAGGSSLDRIALDRFCGPARVADVSGIVGRCVEMADLAQTVERLPAVDFLLLHSGWDRHWHSERYFEDFPVLSAACTRRLTELGLLGIGVDAISVDPLDSATHEIHHLLFGAGMIIIENLTNLRPLLGRDFLFCALPLKIRAGDGSPVRAAALFPETS
ncbi:MAG: cyclase family protein [Acidobacteria bacterium]|nr:cyclase family protein [Acidobacteriota bacterium]